MNKTGIIVSGGSICDEFALKCFDEIKPEVIIGVDGGLSFLRRNYLMPTHIIGDFDSVQEEILSYYKQETAVPIVQLNPIKDESDTESALMLAIRQGVKNLWILGATGTRMDHVWANVQILKIALEHGVQAYILDLHNRISVWQKEILLEKEKCFGKYFSLFPLGEPITDLSIEGAKYPLVHYHLMPYESRCVSNEIAGQNVKITFPQGNVILMETRD